MEKKEFDKSVVGKIKIRFDVPEKEFNLSENIWKDKEWPFDSHIRIDKIKEAVRLLKEELIAQDFQDDETYELKMKKINKIFGEKLI